MVVKFCVTTGLIALLSFVLCLFAPWWTIALAAFAVSALIPQRPLLAFLSGFAALFLLWGLLALVADLRNEGILSSRVAAVLPLGGSSIAILLVTAFVGALVGGGGSLTAAFLRK
jgi:hypothetical protein